MRIQAGESIQPTNRVSRNPWDGSLIPCTAVNETFARGDADCKRLNVSRVEINTEHRMIDQGWALRETRVGGGLSSTAVYAGPAYDEALSRLLFIVEQQRHCGILFGPAGAGKSLLLAQFSRIVRRGSRELAVVDVHQRTGSEVLWELCGELGLSPHYGDTTFTIWRRILDYLQANRGTERPTVVVLDHADQGAEECSALVTRLVHLTSQGQGLTVILAVRGGQLADLPQDLRDASEMRIELAWHDREQTGEFVRAVFQSLTDELPVFTDAAIDRLHVLSQGSPRVLGRLCDLAVLAAMAGDEATITEQTVNTAAADMQFAEPAPSRAVAWKDSSRPWAEI